MAIGRPSGPDSGAAALARRAAADQTAHRLLLEVETLREAGITSMREMARALRERGMPTPRGGDNWTHATVARLLKRVESRSGGVTGHTAASARVPSWRALPAGPP